MKSRKQTALIRFALFALAVVLLNLVGQKVYKRFDLTAEGRFSLSDATTEMLGNLKQPIVVECYLEGDLRPDLKKFRNSIEDVLGEMRSYSNGNFDYVFRNPAESGDPKATKEFMASLYKSGLTPTDLQVKKEDGSFERQTLFPGVIIRSGDRETAVNLLNGTNSGMSGQEILNASSEALEFEIINGIKNAMMVSKPTIGIIEGIGGLERLQMEDFILSLKKFYEVEFYDIGRLEPIPGNFKAIVVPKPSEEISDWKKFKLDNYVMRGGNVLWCVEQINATMDSMSRAGYFLATPYVNDPSGTNLGLDELLFRYGVRVNRDLVQDLKCARIPLVMGSVGGRPSMQPRPWFYFPLTTSDGKHPIVKNVDPVWMQFAGSIDLVESPGISKTVLLTSSRYSRSFPAPARVNLSLAANAPNPALYNKPFLPMAVLLEGKFESIYKNRILNDFAQKAVDSLHFQLYQSAIKPSKQIVISDGDVLANYVSRDGTKVLPLGFDRISNMTWGNRRFVLNCIDYLTDETGFINIRGKEISLRLLNLEKAKKEKVKWQVINMVGPIVLLLGFGLVVSWRRKRKYAR